MAKIGWALFTRSGMLRFTFIAIILVIFINIFFSAWDQWAQPGHIYLGPWRESSIRSWLEWWRKGGVLWWLCWGGPDGPWLLGGQLWGMEAEGRQVFQWNFHIPLIPPQVFLLNWTKLEMTFMQLAFIIVVHLGPDLDIWLHYRRSNHPSKIKCNPTRACHIS